MAPATIKENPDMTQLVNPSSITATYKGRKSRAETFRHGVQMWIEAATTAGLTDDIVVVGFPRGLFSDDGDPDRCLVAHIRVGDADYVLVTSNSYGTESANHVVSARLPVGTLELTYFDHALAVTISTNRSRPVNEMADGWLAAARQAGIEHAKLVGISSEGFVDLATDGNIVARIQIDNRHYTLIQVMPADTGVDEGVVYARLMLEDENLIFEPAHA